MTPCPPLWRHAPPPRAPPYPHDAARCLATTTLRGRPRWGPTHGRASSMTSHFASTPPRVLAATTSGDPVLATASRAVTTTGLYTSSRARLRQRRCTASTYCHHRDAEPCPTIILAITSCSVSGTPTSCRTSLVSQQEPKLPPFHHLRRLSLLRPAPSAIILTSQGSSGSGSRGSNSVVGRPWPYNSPPPPPSTGAAAVGHRCPGALSHPLFVPQHGLQHSLPCLVLA
jgi:hypothetical protein